MRRTAAGSGFGRENSGGGAGGEIPSSDQAAHPTSLAGYATDDVAAIPLTSHVLPGQ